MIKKKRELIEKEYPYLFSGETEDLCYLDYIPEGWQDFAINEIFSKINQLPISTSEIVIEDMKEKNGRLRIDWYYEGYLDDPTFDLIEGILREGEKKSASVCCKCGCQVFEYTPGLPSAWSYPVPFCQGCRAGDALHKMNERLQQL